MISSRPLVGIGLGGICEGWMAPVLLFHETGLVPFSTILLVDGKGFRSSNRSRQYFNKEANKAVERCRNWRELYPKAPLRHRAQYIDHSNVAEIIPEDAIVLLSPDNYATRKLVSDHMETLHNSLLICGGNDGISVEEKNDGTEGAVVVHYKIEGRNITPPLTAYHEVIRHPPDKLPTDVGCVEQAQAGHPQLLATNLMVGAAMAEVLYRYCTMPSEEACQVVEIWLNSRTGERSLYGPKERPIT